MALHKKQPPTPSRNSGVTGLGALEMAFQKSLQQQLSRGETLCGVTNPQLARQAELHGAVAAVTRFLERGQASHGFEALCVAGRPDLTVEALVVRRRYAALFTDQVVDVCYARLLETGYTAFD